MSQEECSKHIEKFHNKTNSITCKSNQANGTRAANGSKITNSNDSTPQATSSDDASTTGPLDALPGSMLRSLLSVNKASQAGIKETRLSPGTNIILNGQTFKACMAKCTYHILKHVQASCSGSLIYGGCNGDLASDDVVGLEESTQLVDITGIATLRLNLCPSALWLVSSAPLRDQLLASFINMQHMKKALQFIQLISFARWSGGQ